MCAYFYHTDWPSATLHVDGDAFFASVYQSVHPETKGKPLAIGRERGIATAISYEAKARGVKRGMLMSEIKKICPECIITHSDYRLFEIFSQKMINIVKRYTPYVEWYSIDEAFADFSCIKKTDYKKTATTIKKDIEASLGLTVSVGVAPTKCLAKIASGFRKPSGLVVFGVTASPYYLRNTKVEDIWGIGPRIGWRLQRMDIFTAYDLINEPLSIIKKYFTKPIVEIWDELHGKKIYEIDTSKKTTYASITRSQTVTPAISDSHILYARLLEHIEKAFLKARGLNYAVGKLVLFLKTQNFTYDAIEINLPEKTAYPYMIREHIRRGFQKIYHKNHLYRASGCTIHNLVKMDCLQTSLFCNTYQEEKIKKVYSLVDLKRIRFASCLFDKQIPHDTKSMEFPSISLDKKHNIVSLS